ncbi:MAG TPA: FG-GAP repeat protein [Candidatus Obscuribacterales bacterium]
MQVTETTEQFAIPTNSQSGVEFTNTQTSEVCYTFSPSGTWKAGKDIPECSAEGFKDVAPEYQKDLKYPNNTAFSLVAVNKKTGAVTEVGKETTILVKPGETLVFLVNDFPPHYADNTGNLTVKVSSQRTTPPSRVPDWGQGQVVQTRLRPPELRADDHFGISVAIDGNQAIVGAYKTDDPDNSGAAYIYQLQNGDWKQMQKLRPPELRGDDHFGISVAIDGNQVMVGAYKTDDPDNGGAVYFFETTT